VIRPVKLDGWRCSNCGHEWLSDNPKKCPQCQRAASGLGRGRPRVKKASKKKSR